MHAHCIHKIIEFKIDSCIKAEKNKQTTNVMQKRGATSVAQPHTFHDMKKDMSVSS